MVETRQRTLHSADLLKIIHHRDFISRALIFETSKPNACDVEAENRSEDFGQQQESLEVDSGAEKEEAGNYAEEFNF